MNMTNLFSTFTDKCADLTPHDKRNVRRYQAWTLAWAIAYVGSTFLIASERLVSGPAAWAAALLPSLMAVFAVLAYARLLREGDELMRAIELQALAMAVGAGFVIWPAFRLATQLGVDLSPWNDLPVLTIIFAYVVGVVMGRKRYG